MQFLKSKNTKKERKQYIDQNPLEVLGKGLKTSLIDELAKASVNEAWDELLDINSNEDKGKAKTEGDLSEGAELNLAQIKKEVREITEEGRRFTSEIIHTGERANAENSQEISVKIQEILIEIKQLSKSSKQLEKQVDIIAIEQTNDNTGIYHVNFLEQMLGVIRDLRLSVEDSLAWFGALRSKKAARQYGTMAKKHGTSFTLSNERQVSTQVG
jgi:hypothetical protein